jgi:hypothetical protein
MDGPTTRAARLLNKFRRRALGEGVTLKLFEKKPGVADEPLLVITDGWYPHSERATAETATTLLVEIVEQDDMTTEVMAKTDRVEIAGVRYMLENWESPLKSPRLWQLFLRELKPGAPRR